MIFSPAAATTFSLMRVRLFAALIALLLVAGGCRTGYDYQSADSPRYAGVHADPAVENCANPCKLRIVSFNCHFARDVDGAIARDAGRNPAVASVLHSPLLMPDKARNQASDDNTQDAELGAQADTPDAESQRRMRERVTQLAFGGDPLRFDQFVRTLREATPEGVDVILRGSAVTGHKWGSDEPFDAEGAGTSDLDVTFVGGDMVMLFSEFHIPGIHSVPLSNEHPYASSTLGPLRERLCAMTHRAVNLQATASLVQYLREAVLDQPYLVLIKAEANAAGTSNPRSDG